MSRLALAVLVLATQAAARPKYSGYTLYKDAGGYLMYHEIPVTFDDAKRRCAVEGGVLASPINDGIKAAMIDIFKTRNGKNNVFTGFSSTSNNGGIFTSIEGTQLSDTEHTWALDEPNNVDGHEQCIMLSPHGIMSDVPCDNRNPYLCFLREEGVKNISGIKNGAALAVRPNSKYGGYTLYKDAWGCLMYHEIPVTFDHAKRRCTAEGGVLASPIYNGIKAAMLDILKTRNGKKNVFTGFYAELHNGGIFSSIEGTQLSHIEHTWARDEPNNVDGHEQCIMLSPHGIMSDVQCDNRNPYLCFLSEERVMNVLCDREDYALDNTTGSCYKFHNNDLVYDEAAKVCEQEGGHLAIINGDNEAQALKNLMNKNTRGVAMLGFQLNKNSGKWMTLQGETIEDAGFAKWLLGVNSSYLASAAPTMASGLLYNDGVLYYSSPSTALPFICEKNPSCL